MSPRNVRNFWIEVDVDGRQEKIAAGPKGKDGGMEIQLHQRDYGGVSHVLSIWCHSNRDGLLVTEIQPRMKFVESNNGELRYITER